jgi:hypothetical protein
MNTVTTGPGKVVTIVMTTTTKSYLSKEDRRMTGHYLYCKGGGGEIASW